MNRIETFNKLHNSEDILFLCNAWDLLSALTLEKAGFQAPLNVLSLPGLTNCNKLKALGVQRFSFGNALSDKIHTFMDMNATQLFELKDTESLYS